MSTLPYDTGLRTRYQRLALAAGLLTLWASAYFVIIIGIDLLQTLAPTPTQGMLSLSMLPRLFTVVTFFAATLLFCGVLPDQATPRLRRRRIACIAAASLFALLTIVSGIFWLLAISAIFAPVPTMSVQLYFNIASICEAVASLFQICLYIAAAIFLRHIAQVSHSRALAFLSPRAMALSSVLTLLTSALLLLQMAYDTPPSWYATLSSWTYLALYGILTIHWLTLTLWSLRRRHP